LNWVDILIGGSFFIGFVAGTTGRGLLGLSLPFAAAAISAGVGYIFAGDLAEAGFAKWVAGGILFAAVFSAFLISGRILKKIPGADSVFRAADACISALVISAAAVLAVSVAERVSEGGTGAEQSVLYSKASSLLIFTKENYEDFHPSEKQ